MRLPASFAAAFALAASAGCTHHSLTRNTALTTTTVMDIQYAAVLNNLAMMSCHPEALPNHANLADGVVQVNDRLGFGNSGGFTSLGGGFGIERFGPDGQRQLTEQWGTDATTDPERLVDLQALYRVALGLHPLALPNAIAYLRQKTIDGKSDGGSGGDSSSPKSKTTSGGGGSTPSGGGDSSSGDSRQVPIDVLLTDVPPPGWYGVGGKKDVPKDACYVGRWEDRYAWVTAGGMPHLARFTVCVLAVTKLKPGERSGGGGLAVTAGGR